MLITPEQIRAARALVRLDQTTLARGAGITVPTLQRLEDHHGLSKVAPTIVDAVRRTLENAGVEFIDRGVRWRASAPVTIQSIKDDVNLIVAHGSALLAKYPPLTDDDMSQTNRVMPRSLQ